MLKVKVGLRLAICDQVISHDSGDGKAGFLLVKSVELQDERQDTFNFEVADTHTYFVGKLNALVHNACSPNDLISNGGRQLDNNTIVGAYGNRFTRNAGGTYTNAGPATQSQISQSGVTVRPAPNSALPKGTLSNKEAREFYHSRKTELLDRVDPDAPIEAQARQAHAAGNQARQEARDSMSDRDAVSQLDRTDPNPTFDELMAREATRGNYGADAHNAIVESARRTRISVDETYLDQ